MNAACVKVPALIVRSSVFTIWLWYIFVYVTVRYEGLLNKEQNQNNNNLR